MAKRRRVRTDGRPRLDRPKIDGKRSDAWYIVWSEGGRSQRRSTGTTDRRVAEARLTRWLAAQAKPEETHTVNDALDHYITYLEMKGAKTIANVKSALKPIRVTFGALPPNEIYPSLLREYGAMRKRQPRLAGTPGKVGDRSVSVELAYLRAALKQAKRDGLITTGIPDIVLPKNAGVRRRKRFLTDAEIAKLLLAVKSDDTEPHLRLMVTLALMTAQRGVAIRSLEWKHVDWDSGVVWFSQTDPDPAANKSRQDMPLTPALRRVLAAAHEVARTGWVIEWRDGPVTSVKKGFAALVKRAGLANVTFHDLRRTVATQGLRRGHGFDVVAALLGDDVAVVRAHYAHVDPALLASVMPTLEGPDSSDKAQSALTDERDAAEGAA